MNRLLLALAILLGPISVSLAQSPSLSFLKANHKLSLRSQTIKVPEKIEDNDVMRITKLSYKGGSGFDNPVANTTPTPSRFDFVNRNPKLRHAQRLPIKRIRAYEKKLKQIDKEEAVQEKLSDK